MMSGSAKVAAGVALSGLVRGGAAVAQLPPPQPMQDDRSAFVTTTEARAWQKGELFKPTFRWDMLNLNVDPARSGGESGTAPVMEGFGACFNELGWTSSPRAPTESEPSFRILPV